MKFCFTIRRNKNRKSKCLNSIFWKKKRERERFNQIWTWAQSDLMWVEPIQNPVGQNRSSSTIITHYYNLLCIKKQAPSKTGAACHFSCTSQFILTSKFSMAVLPDPIRLNIIQYGPNTTWGPGWVLVTGVDLWRSLPQCPKSTSAFITCVARVCSHQLFPA